MFTKKNAKESINVWLACSAITFVVEMHFKEVTQQKVTLFFHVLFIKVKPTSRYDVILHSRYDVTGVELTVWPETFNWLAVTNAG